MSNLCFKDNNIYLNANFFDVIADSILETEKPKILKLEEFLKLS